MATTSVKLAAARYGKDRVRVLRVVRKGEWHEVVEYTVKALLEGDIETSYTKSDNSVVVATDSIKNTINVHAKTSPYVLQPETFALELGTHFVETYPHIHKAFIDIIQHRWSRIPLDGQDHPHSFVRDGNDVKVISVEVDGTAGKDKVKANVKSGISDLLVLKSTGSSFEGFLRDEYTTLGEVDDRIFSTSVNCTYTVNLPAGPLTKSSLANLNVPFDNISSSVRDTTLRIFATDDSASVQATLYKMCEKIIGDNKEVDEVRYGLPNKHYIPINLDFKNLPNLKPKDAEVFVPTADPSGLITATVVRA